MPGKARESVTTSYAAIAARDPKTAFTPCIRSVAGRPAA